MKEFFYPHTGKMEIFGNWDDQCKPENLLSFLTPVKKIKRFFHFISNQSFGFVLVSFHIRVFQ